jgi:nucleotide-binding universal stress UspA family protein
MKAISLCAPLSTLRPLAGRSAPVQAWRSHGSVWTSSSQGCRWPIGRVHVLRVGYADLCSRRPLESPIAGGVTKLDYYEQRLRNEICPFTERDGFKTDIVAVAGDPGEEITRIAREREVSLVLVGSRGGRPPRGRCLGRVAWDVVQCAWLPVLVQRVEPAFDDVLRFADQSHDSLMVLDTRGRGWLSELLVGSVSHDILRRTPGASVLLVRVPQTANSAVEAGVSTYERK